MKRNTRKAGQSSEPEGTSSSRTRKRPPWTYALAAALALIILAGAALHFTSGAPDAAAIYEAQYPQMSPYYGDSGDYNSWREDRSRQLNQPEGYGDGLDGFVSSTARQLLTGQENSVYSPLSIYMALSMLSEATDGNTRQQIFSLLGVDSIEELRTKASSIWNASYCDDGAYTCILANSMWLQKDLDYNMETLKTLSDTYYASSYSGDLGSADMNAALQNWLNEQTGGLLSDYAKGIELSRETVLALCSTVYLKARWSSEFNENLTKADIFHSPQGDIEVPFMNNSSSSSYYWGEGFGAVIQSLKEGGSMYLILPEEGVTPDELLAGEAVMDFIMTGSDWPNTRDNIIVNLSMPKFDISMEVGLKDCLNTLGITDVTNPALADFSPLLQNSDMPVWLNQAQHAARVTVDEEGLTAAAFTVMIMLGGYGSSPADEIDFVLDRPFIFAITGIDGLPLFIGVVNQP